MADVIRRLGDLLRWGNRGLPVTYPAIEYVADRAGLPETIGPRDFLVVGTRGRPKWAILDCPCRRGHLIEVCLQEAIDPHWTLRTQRGRPTLNPSIHLQGDRSCHFVVRRGTVRWVSDIRPS